MNFKSRGIRVNAIAPGYIRSDMTAQLNQSELIKNIPLGKLGEPKDGILS